MGRRATEIFALGIVLSSLPLLMGNKGCLPESHVPDGSQASEAGQPFDAQPACTEAECGPAPGAPNYLCADGSQGGPGACQRLADGHCGYPMHTCSDAGTSAGGALCGTRGAAECATGQFCDFPAGSQCGALDRGGSCRERPEVCDTVYAPVCGCDTKTYSSACVAHAAGVSVMQDGECGGGQGGEADGSTPSPAGKTCGGFAGLVCPDGQFCNYEPAVGGMGCDGIADGTGVCQPQTSICTREYRPVCGCDRKTHPTACVAHSQGVSVLHDGMCTDVDCKAIGGRPVDGIGPAPSCAKGETDHGAIQYAGGQIAIEGTICCVP